MSIGYTALPSTSDDQQYFRGLWARIFGQFIQSAREKAGLAVEPAAWLAGMSSMEWETMASVILMCRQAWGISEGQFRRPASGSALTHNRIHSPSGKGVSAIKKAVEPKVKRMNLNVPVELHNSFKSVTAAQGQNMTDVLLEFIEQYVADHDRGVRKPKGRRQ